MRIFISWSGDTSGRVGRLLYSWIPVVLQHVKPFLSSEEVEKGARWYTTLAQELEQADFGIVCLTADSLNSSWLHFEAGAISKSIDRARVAPILFEIEPSEVRGPLAQFQLTRFNKEEINRLILSINSASGDQRVSESNLDRIYSMAWPSIEEDVRNVFESEGSVVQVGSNGKAETLVILEEVLDIVRFQARYISSNDIADQIAARILPIVYPSNIVDPAGRTTTNKLSNSIATYLYQHIALSDVIKRYVKINRRGREWIGLCPFHQERTPSFNVVDDRGFYHCFGCGAHGDLIAFVMALEGDTYDEAIRRIITEIIPWGKSSKDDDESS